MGAGDGGKWEGLKALASRIKEQLTQIHLLFHGVKVLADWSQPSRLEGACCIEFK